MILSRKVPVATPQLGCTKIVLKYAYTPKWIGDVLIWLEYYFEEYEYKNAPSHLWIGNSVFDTIDLPQWVLRRRGRVDDLEDSKPLTIPLDPSKLETRS